MYSASPFPELQQVAFRSQSYSVGLCIM